MLQCRVDTVTGSQRPRGHPAPPPLPSGARRLPSASRPAHARRRRRLRGAPWPRHGSAAAGPPWRRRRAGGWRPCPAWCSAPPCCCRGPSCRGAAGGRSPGPRRPRVRARCGPPRRGRVSRRCRGAAGRPQLGRRSVVCASHLPPGALGPLLSQNAIFGVAGRVLFPLCKRAARVTEIARFHAASSLL